MVAADALHQVLLLPLLLHLEPPRIMYSECHWVWIRGTSHSVAPPKGSTPGCTGDEGNGKGREAGVGVELRVGLLSTILHRLHTKDRTAVCNVDTSDTLCIDMQASFGMAGQGESRVLTGPAGVKFEEPAGSSAALGQGEGG